MAARASKISLLSLLATLALASSAATQAGTRGGSAVPQNVITEEQVKDPRIGNPKEADGANCFLNLSEQEIGELRRQGITQSGKCMPQSDAFKLAAEAASYLGHYQRAYSNYAAARGDEKTNKKYNDAIKACIVERTGCDQEKQDLLVGAIVQYNFSKEIKAQMLENQYRAERMRSINLKPEEWKEAEIAPTKLLNHEGRLKTGSTRDYSFRLNPKTIQAIDFTRLSTEERNKLGAEFERDFNQFVTEYASSTGRQGPKSRWYYVPARSAAVGAQQTISIPQLTSKEGDIKMGQAYVNEGKRDRDIRMENSKEAQEAIANYKKVYGKPLESPYKNVKVGVDEEGEDIIHTQNAVQTAYEQAGFGMPKGVVDPKTNKPLTPKEIAATVVMNINRDITQAEDGYKNASQQNERFPSSVLSASNGTTETIHTAMIDVKAFDGFLDEIWPYGVQKRIPRKKP